ncbi:MAG: uroporphyrinogen-III C-methyltransferase [Hyphomicrobium sp.]|nr:uroporphyrinogen-III C-methyltransferase [Hyphomicrobium sp.]
MGGVVAFVSSGPGDPELLTLKAVSRLQTADVVLYDDLSSGGILAHAREGANLICVGKRARLPSAKQDHVSRLLVDYAITGARVVRLKSGDAGIFGRLEEEIATLRAAGVPYEIVPGVTSACAAAAAAGLPLTRRYTARRVQFVTGSDVSGGVPADLNWVALADPQATTAVFMGKQNFHLFSAHLMEHGLPPTTPAILAQSVGHGSQKLLRSTVGKLAQELSREAPSSTAVILYGPLV